MKIRGNFIKRLRKVHGYSRERMGDIIGYSASAIWKLEYSGHPRAEIEMLARIAIVFHIAIEDMIDMEAVHDDLEKIKEINNKIPTIS